MMSKKAINRYKLPVPERSVTQSSLEAVNDTSAVNYAENQSAK